MMAALDLAVEVFCGCIAGIKPVGCKNAGQMALRLLIKCLKGSSQLRRAQEI